MSQHAAVLIPAYNASRTILELIERISVHIPENDIIVVDDGSEDQTSDLVEKTEATILKHSKNKGKGEALKTGFRYAVEQGYDLVITLDSDLQHDPKFIKSFLSRAKANNTDLILGKRNIDPGIMPFHRYLSNKLTSTIISILTGKSIKDSQSGYRLINVKALKSLDLQSREYDLESEILLKAAKRGLKIDSVAISTIYADASGFISPFADTWRFLLLLWRSLWW